MVLDIKKSGQYSAYNYDISTHTQCLIINIIMNNEIRSELIRPSLYSLYLELHFP